MTSGDSKGVCTRKWVRAMQQDSLPLSRSLDKMSKGNHWGTGRSCDWSVIGPRAAPISTSFHKLGPPRLGPGWPTPGFGRFGLLDSSVYVWTDSRGVVECGQDGRKYYRWFVKDLDGLVVVERPSWVQETREARIKSYISYSARRLVLWGKC